LKKTLLNLIALVTVFNFYGQEIKNVKAIDKIINLTAKEIYEKRLPLKVKNLDSITIKNIEGNQIKAGQEIRGFYKNEEIKMLVYTVSTNESVYRIAYNFTGQSVISVYECEQVFPKFNSLSLDAKFIYTAMYYLETNRVFRTEITGEKNIGRTFVITNSTISNEISKILKNLKPVPYTNL